MNALLSYIQGSLEELRQVQWPTQQQAIRLSTIVVIFIALCSLFFGLVDGILFEVIRATMSA